MNTTETCGFCLKPECEPASLIPVRLTYTDAHDSYTHLSEAESLLEAAKIIQILVRSFAAENGGCLGDSQCYFAAPDSEADGDNITVGEFAKHFIEEGLDTFGVFTYYLPFDDDDSDGHYVTVVHA